jgi:hypothetical protein
VKFDDLFDQRPSQVAPVIDLPMASGETTAYGRAALESELDILAGTGEGGRNHQLNTSMFKIAQLVSGGQVSEAEALDRFGATGRTIGLDPGEIRATLRSAIKGGRKSPRVPAPQYTEISAGEPFTHAANGQNPEPPEGEE